MRLISIAPALVWLLSSNVVYRVLGVEKNIAQNARVKKTVATILRVDVAAFFFTIEFVCMGQVV